MSGGVLLGIATAVSWGSSDFFARFATRSIGSIRAVFWMQAWGALFLTIFLFCARDWGHLFDGSGWQPWAWGALAGVLTTLGLLALYRSFQLGKMAVVAPISASYPVLTILLTLFSGERLSGARMIGIAAALLGVLLVAASEKSKDVPNESESCELHVVSSRAGIVWAVSAGLVFGITFWLLGSRTIPRTGALATVWLLRVTGTLLTACLLGAQKIPLRFGNAKPAGQTAAMGLLDTGAFAFSNVGMQLEQVGIVSVLGSLYGAVTVILAALFLRERIVPQQWTGIAAIFLGIILMNI